MNMEIVEDIAKRWATIDGKLDKFLQCKADSVLDNELGYYEGYIEDAKELYLGLEKYLKLCIF